MYAYKEKYTLDFSNIQHYDEIHQIIKKELDFPPYYGENWDALWDCLTEMVDVDEPLYIEILGAEVLNKYRNYVNVAIICGEAQYEIQ